MPFAAVLALAVGLTLGGCAPRVITPVVSPTGIVYELGTPPEETRYSQVAALYLEQGRVHDAMAQAQEGLAAEPGNPIHYFVAGLAHAGLGEYEEADLMWRDAQRIYPAYELLIEPRREDAWAAAFNAGLDAYNQGDASMTIRVWKQAALIFDLRPEAHQSLATILAQEGDYDGAIEMYRLGLAGLERVPATYVLTDDDIRDRTAIREVMEENLTQLLLLTERFEDAEPLLRLQIERDPANVRLRSNLATALAGMGRDPEATEIYASLLSAPDLNATDLLNVGSSLFRSADFFGAAEAFERLTRLQPEGREGWFNYANALYATESWESLVPAGERLVELDPLNENSSLILAKAYLMVEDEAAALRALERIDAVPVHVDELQMQGGAATTIVRGRVVTNTAEPGTTVSLRFVFYRDAEMLGSEIISVAVPPNEEGLPFEVSFGLPASAYRYELVP